MPDRLSPRLASAVRYEFVSFGLFLQPERVLFDSPRPTDSDGSRAIPFSCARLPARLYRRVQFSDAHRGQTLLESAAPLRERRSPLLVEILAALDLTFRSFLTC